MSAIRSSTFSIPTESRTSPSRIPTFSRSSRGMLAWVIEAYTDGEVSAEYVALKRRPKPTRRPRERELDDTEPASPPSSDVVAALDAPSVDDGEEGDRGLSFSAVGMLGAERVDVLWAEPLVYRAVALPEQERRLLAGSLIEPAEVLARVPAKRTLSASSSPVRGSREASRSEGPTSW